MFRADIRVHGRLTSTHTAQTVEGAIHKAREVSPDPGAPGVTITVRDADGRVRAQRAACGPWERWDASCWID